MYVISQILWNTQMFYNIHCSLIVEIIIFIILFPISDLDNIIFYHIIAIDILLDVQEYRNMVDYYYHNPNVWIYTLIEIIIYWYHCSVQRALVRPCRESSGRGWASSVRPSRHVITDIILCAVRFRASVSGVVHERVFFLFIYNDCGRFIINNT